MKTLHVHVPKGFDYSSIHEFIDAIRRNNVNVTGEVSPKDSLLQISYRNNDNYRREYGIEAVTSFLKQLAEK